MPQAFDLLLDLSDELDVALQQDFLPPHAFEELDFALASLFVLLLPLVMLLDCSFFAALTVALSLLALVFLQNILKTRFSFILTMANIPPRQNMMNF